MRLGGPVFDPHSDPDAWIAALQRLGYRAAACPVKNDADDQAILAYACAAQKAGVIIAEVGAWSNPISPDPQTRTTAIRFCQEQLALADRIGARCCVNIAGSRGERWDGPHPHNLTRDTFDLIVETVRQIVDAVNPTRTFYTLETMPWAYPDSADAYLDLIRAVDRERFAVHLDPVNLISSPQRFYRNDDLIRDCFRKLGPYIQSCHAKDIRLGDALTVHLDEVRPGTGALDYRTYLQELTKLDPDTPLMLEHLPTAEEYALAAEHIRGTAYRLGISLQL
jgi:sugar phosphate isomerase/epimerase